MKYIIILFVLFSCTPATKKEIKKDLSNGLVCIKMLKNNMCFCCNTNVSGNSCAVGSNFSSYAIMDCDNVKYMDIRIIDHGEK